MVNKNARVRFGTLGSSHSSSYGDETRLGVAENNLATCARQLDLGPIDAAVGQLRDGDVSVVGRVLTVGLDPVRSAQPIYV